MKHLRAISLCYVSYKLISKILANSHETVSVLPMNVDDNQSAFVLGRLITDDVIIAAEVSHAKKIGTMASKLDMSKAFSNMSLRFLTLFLLMGKLLWSP